MRPTAPPIPLLNAARLLLALLLPLWVLAWVQRDAGSMQSAAWRLSEARAWVSDAERPPLELQRAERRALPLQRAAGERQALWLAFDLPPSSQPRWLKLSFRPDLALFIDGQPLLASTPGGESLVLGHREIGLPIGPSLAPRQLQLRLASPGPSGASLDAPLLGPPEALQLLDGERRFWQVLRAVTVLGGLLVALFLGLVAAVRREEPLYRLGAAHVALLALLLTPYVLPEQPLPSPEWRALLDAADLAAKLLLVALTAHLAGDWSRGLRRLLWGLALLGLPIDLLAAWQGWAWTGFDHPWPWWALGVRAALLLLAWGFVLRGLLREPGAGRLGTALLVGFSALTWAWVSLGVLVWERPVIDSNALAHAGWVLWVAAQLARLFLRSARRDAALRRELELELAQRTEALQAAYRAQAEAERREAAAEQRRRLLQDLHDGLGARLLQLRLTAPQLDAQGLAEAVDACLLEMRLSIDTLSETDGELGVLLGSWRQRIEPLLQAAGVRMNWRLQHDAVLPQLQGAGALELVRWLQEALANVLRHAETGQLTVATEADAETLTVWFVDDGRGMPALPVEGQGLRSLRARAERLQAGLTWHSPAPRRFVPDPRAGTALALRFSLETAVNRSAPHASPDQHNELGPRPRSPLG